MVELEPAVLTAIVLVTLAIGAAIGRALSPKPRVNTTVDLANPKVVHKCPIPDIEDMFEENKKEVVAFCRCWKSKNMPYCDGSHAKHNKECGDNVGPLLIPMPEKRRRKSK